MYKLIFIIFFSINSFASNIEYISGNITYKYLFGACSGVTYYDITVNICTKLFKTTGDSIKIQFGDGTQGYAKRTDSIKIGNNTLKSIYKKIHAYGSCGTYFVYYSDTINIQNVKNISMSNKEKFTLSTTVVLNPFYAPVSSYKIFNSPATKIFKNKVFTFNTIASTNNTLVYDSIIHSLFPIGTGSTYSMYIPNGVKINRYSGEIQWINPDTLGYYAFMPVTKMYKDGYMVASSIEYYKFEVINHSPTYIYDSISKVPVNSDNYKEIIYTANNTYSFICVYSDLMADSVKTFIYPIDFFTTTPAVSITNNTIKKNTVNFSWSPVNLDDRLYPYNVVLNFRSFYGNDSVANTYQTVSFYSSIINSLTKNDITINNLLIYPNPTSSIINIIDEQNELQNSSITITNTLGQTVLSMPFSHQIDVSSLAQGLYYLTLQDGNIKKTVKFVRE